jgi:hypothetical protein
MSEANLLALLRTAVHSRVLNPECEHVEDDMRTVRLGRQFDCVFIHDAVAYMTTESDLRRAIETAFVHCPAKLTHLEAFPL